MRIVKSPRYEKWASSLRDRNGDVYKRQVSSLTAAALVVAPVGGVAATYTTGYAEDGEAWRCTAEEKAFPKTYEELVERINGGELFSLADLEVMAGSILTAEQYGELYPAFEEMCIRDRPRPLREPAQRRRRLAAPEGPGRDEDARPLYLYVRHRR